MSWTALPAKQLSLVLEAARTCRVGLAPTITFTSSQTGGTPSLALSSSLTGASRILISGTDTLSYVVSNPGTATLNQWGLTTSANTGGVIPTSTSGSSLAASGSVTVAGTFTASTSQGIDTITGTASSSDAGVSTVAASSTVDIVAPRPLTVSQTPTGILSFGQWNVTVTGTGDDTLWTKPTTTGSSYATGGITVTSTAGTFTQSNTSETLSLTFTTNGPTPAITGNDLVTNGVIAKELAGETVNISGSAVVAGTVVGTATASAGGLTAHTAGFTGTFLQSQVPAAGTYQKLASVVVGDLGTTATIIAGTASTATTVSMTWRTRANDELPPGQVPPMGKDGGHWLASDVVKVNGTNSDVYVLEMTYDSALFGGNDLSNLTNGNLWIGMFPSSPTAGSQWENAVDPITKGPDAPATGVHNDFADFFAGSGAGGNLANVVVLGASTPRRIRVSP